MIDFDALVLGPCQAIFARPVLVTPLASQPGDPFAVPPVAAGLPYIARGIWRSVPVDIQTEAGIVSSQTHTLAIRDTEFPIPIVQNDQIEIDAFMSQPRIGICLIEDVDSDGAGETTLSLKVVGQ